MVERPAFPPIEHQQVERGQEPGRSLGAHDEVHHARVVRGLLVGHDPGVVPELHADLEHHPLGGPADLVEQPAKVMRIGSMIRQLLEEVKAAPLDEASRQRLKEIHAASIKELESGLAPELVEELVELRTTVHDDDAIDALADIAVHDPVLVRVIERLANLGANVCGERGRKRTLLEQTGHATWGNEVPAADVRAALDSLISN